MSTRDPRQDPRNGDVLANSDGVHFYVRDFDSSEGVVSYQQGDGGDLLRIYIEEWQFCSTGDTVIRRGEG